MTYRPVLVIQGDGSRFQWENCGPACSGTHLDRDTRGASRTTGARVRALTGDLSGGTNLAEDDTALLRGWGPRDHMDVRPRVAWADVLAALDRGQGVSLSASYAPISGTVWDGSPGFTANHRFFINERGSNGLYVYDPLADGRRAGIPKGPHWIPESIMERAAGLLMLDPETRRRIGLGYAQVGLTRDTEPDYRAVVTAALAPAYFWRYFVDSLGRITGHDKAHTGGFSATCSAPQLHGWATAAARAKYSPRSLVRLTSGSRSGWYVQPGSGHVTIRRI